MRWWNDGRSHEANNYPLSSPSGVWHLLLIPDISETALKTYAAFSAHWHNLRSSDWTVLWTLSFFYGALKRHCTDRRFFFIQTHRQFCTLLRFRSGDVGSICERLCKHKEEGQAGGRDCTWSNCAFWQTVLRQVSGSQREPAYLL